MTFASAQQDQHNLYTARLHRVALALDVNHMFLRERRLISRKLLTPSFLIERVKSIKISLL